LCMKYTFKQISGICLLIVFGLGFQTEWVASQPAELPARAFTNVTVHYADGTSQANASVVWRGGVIEAVGRNVTIPFDARVIDGGDSLHVYPGFINGFSTWGAPDREQFRDSAPIPGYPTYERAGIQTDRRPELLIEDKPVFKEALKQGFTTSLIGLNGYMLPGSVSIFHLSDKNISENSYQRNLGQVFKFDFSRGAYPSTLMGVMARLRQLFYDAEALKSHQQLFASSAGNATISVPQNDPVLEALFPIMDKQQPFFAHADSPADIERMLRLKSELGFNMVVVGGKQAALMAEKLAAQNVPVLLTLELPKKPDWMKESEKKEKAEESSEESDEAKEDKETLTEEEHNFRERQVESYEEHLLNLRQLLNAGVRVGVSLNGVKPADASGTILQLVEYGYTKTEILSMLTSGTASILNQNRLGNLRTGMIANMAVFQNEAFSKEAKALYTVSAGQLFNLKNLD
jgi:imidazolonepropionase-like amidohydrolase